MEKLTKAVKALKSKFERRRGVNTHKYVIQSVHSDGFTYWFGGIGMTRMYTAEVPGVKWTPYWDDTVMFEKKSLALEAMRFYKLENSEVIADSKADYHLAFDLTPARVALFMKYEQSRKEEFEKGIVEVPADKIMDSSKIPDNG